MKYYLFVFMVFTALACSSEESHASGSTQDLSEMIPGTWESVSFKVTVHSADNQVDSSYIFDVPEKDWKRMLGVPPIKTYYESKSGSTYFTEYYNGDGSISEVIRGKWYAQGDTLLLVSPEASYQYGVFISGGRGTFQAILDWDGDGQEDDEYIGVQRKISNYIK